MNNDLISGEGFDENLRSNNMGWRLDKNHCTKEDNSNLQILVDKLKQWKLT